MLCHLVAQVIYCSHTIDCNRLPSYAVNTFGRLLSKNIFLAPFYTASSLSSLVRSVLFMALMMKVAQYRSQCTVYYIHISTYFTFEYLMRKFNIKTQRDIYSAGICTAMFTCDVAKSLFSSFQCTNPTRSGKGCVN